MSSSSKISIASNGRIIPITTEDMDRMESQEKPKKKELQTFLDCCKDNLSFIQRHLTLYTIDGHKLDPECCAPLPEGTGKIVGQRMIRLLLSGQKVNGKENQWSNGCFGSRWCDIDVSDLGIDYARSAFYSKKYTTLPEWNFPTDYVIKITIEKGKD